MPIHQNPDGTWQWGKSGKKYKKKADAIKQMQAIFANGYREPKQKKKAFYKLASDEFWNPNNYMQFPANATKQQIAYVNDYNKKLAYRIALARQESSLRPGIVNGKAYGLTQVQPQAIAELVRNNKLPANITAESLVNNPERAMYVADVYQRHINRPGYRIFTNDDGTREIGRQPIAEINTINNPAISYYRYTRGRNKHANKVFALRGTKGVTPEQIKAMTEQSLAMQDDRVQKFMVHYNDELKRIPVYGQTNTYTAPRIPTKKPTVKTPAVKPQLYKAVKGDTVYGIWKNRFKHIPWNDFHNKWLKLNKSDTLVAGKQYNLNF